MQTSSDSAFRNTLAQSALPSLDGIRALAVFLVVYYHMGISPIFDGALGVLIFFTLSGFLITWVLLREFRTTQTVSLRAFYQRRALRIFPAFYVYWLFIIVTDHFRHATIQWNQAWSSFVYLSNYHHAIFRPRPEYIMHTWSLGVEEQFYMLWPALFLLGMRRSAKVLAMSLAALIGLIWVYRIIHWTMFHNREYLSYAFDSRADALLAGCLFAVLLSHQLGISFLMPILRLSSLTGLCGLAACSFAEHVLGNQFRFTFGLAIAPILTALWVGQLIYNSNSGLGWLFNTTIVRYIGLISYSIYLYHGVGVWISKPFASVPVRLLVAGLGSIAIASVSYWAIEKPFLALKSRWAVKRAEHESEHVLRTTDLECLRPR